MNKKKSADPAVLESLKKGNYADAARKLLFSQKKSWLQLQEGYEFLKDVKEKEFSFSNFRIKMQYNPGRITSSAAKVDPVSVKARKCFLCLENLPEEQEGIIYSDKYIILANPFPIFTEHFTISSLEHLPQEIGHSFHTILRLAKDLSPFTAFYNGPKCGASAPDHLHFQACSGNIMPLENEVGDLKIRCGDLLLLKKNSAVYSIDDGLRKFFLMESDEEPVLRKIFDAVNQAMRNYLLLNEEPMMNLIVKYDGFSWSVIIFFREKHRPSYFDEGILWSPAAVDLGGIPIFPDEMNFNMISKQHLVQGYTEIIIDEKAFLYIKDKIKEQRDCIN